MAGQEMIYARNTITNQEREFTKLVWDNIVDSSDDKGNPVPKSGWVIASRPTEKPKAAIEAEAAAAAAKADAEKRAEAQKDAEAKAHKLIADVEAKIIQGVNEKFDYKTEIRPYLDAKGWTTEIGGKPLPEAILEIRKRIIK